MSLQEILDHRRAVRHFDPKKPLDSTVVKKCIEQATLAPTSPKPSCQLHDKPPKVVS